MSSVMRSAIIRVIYGVLVFVAILLQALEMAPGLLRRGEVMPALLAGAVGGVLAGLAAGGGWARGLLTGLVGVLCVPLISQLDFVVFVITTPPPTAPGILERLVIIILSVVRQFIRDVDPASVLSLAAAGLAGAAAGGWWRGRSARRR